VNERAVMAATATVIQSLPGKFRSMNRSPFQGSPGIIAKISLLENRKIFRQDYRIFANCWAEILPA
jgi:hypothetical protein